MSAPSRSARIISMTFSALLVAAGGGCDTRDAVEEPPCDGLCVDILAETSREPFVVGFDLRLRQGETAIKEGVKSTNFTVFENGQPLDLSESNQFVRDGEGLTMKLMLVLDYTNSMAEAGRIGPMIDAATAFVEPSPFVSEDDLALIEIRHSAQEAVDRILVSDFFPANCETRERVAQGTLNPNTNLCALGSVWDAVGLAILRLDLEQETRNRVVVFITDGQDGFPTGPVTICRHPETGALSCPRQAPGGALVCGAVEDEDASVQLQAIDVGFDSAQAVIDLANAGDNRVRLVPVGLGHTFRKTAELQAMAESTGGVFVEAEMLDGENGLHTRLADVGDYLRQIPGPLNVVLVLDYTVSASQAEILQLIETVRGFVQPEHFNATQQIGVVEFHDRTGPSEGFDEVVPLTSADCAGRAAILQGIPGPGTLEYGQTRLWDAVNFGLNQLLQAEQAELLAGGGQARLALVFLTDGNDTTSETDKELILARARINRVALYPIDFGPPAAEGTAFAELLQRMADTSRGRYFAAEDTAELRQAFKDIAQDLRGQWSLTYITQRNSGEVDVDVTFDWDDRRTNFAYKFDATTLDGEIHSGSLEVFDCRESDSDVTCRVRARYIPRNITRFRFRLPRGAEFRLQGSGGLTPPSNGWTLCHRDEGRCVELVRNRGVRHDEADSERAGRPELTLEGQPLQFGTFGNIGTITVTKDAVREQIEALQRQLEREREQRPGMVPLTELVPDDTLPVLVMPMTHDDTVYAGLPQPKSMQLRGAVMPLISDVAGKPCDCPCAEDLDEDEPGCTDATPSATAQQQPDDAARIRRQDDETRNRPGRSRPSR